MPFSFAALQVVDFGDVAVLRLTAEASIPPGGDRRRVNFAFDGGYVQFKAVPVRAGSVWRHHPKWTGGPGVSARLLRTAAVFGRPAVHSGRCVSRQGGTPRRFRPTLQDSAHLPAPSQQVKIPYPVPFKLLGDEAKGWLDTTYLSSTIRISRGNKGTTFVLSRR